MEEIWLLNSGSGNKMFKSIVLNLWHVLKPGSYHHQVCLRNKIKVEWFLDCLMKPLWKEPLMFLSLSTDFDLDWTLLILLGNWVRFSLELHKWVVSRDEHVFVYYLDLAYIKPNCGLIQPLSLCIETNPFGSLTSLSRLGWITSQVWESTS